MFVCNKVIIFTCSFYIVPQQIAQLTIYKAFHYKDATAICYVQSFLYYEIVTNKENKTYQSVVLSTVIIL